MTGEIQLLSHQEWLMKLLRKLETEALDSRRHPVNLTFQNTVPGCIYIIAFLAGIYIIVQVCEMWIAPINEISALYVCGVALIIYIPTLMILFERSGYGWRKPVWQEILSLIEYTRLIIIDSGLLYLVLIDENVELFPELQYRAGELIPGESVHKYTGINLPQHRPTSIRVLISRLIYCYRSCCRHLGYSPYPIVGVASYEYLALKGQPENFLRLAVTIVLYQELFDPQFTSIKLPPVAREWLKQQPPVEAAPLASPAGIDDPDWS